MAPQSAAALQNVIQAAAMLGSRETSWMGKVPASGQNKKWDVHIKAPAMMGSRETSWMGKVPETSVVNLDPDPVGSGYGSPRIRNFFSAPELFVSDPEPARKKVQIR